jgi:MFS family permease
VTPVAEVPTAARRAVFSAFLLNGIAGGNWFVRIPAIQDNLDLSKSQLGLALLGMPLGAIVAMPIAGLLISRIGSRWVLWGATLSYCVGAASPGLAPSLPSLAVLLALFGAANGFMDVSMNAQGVAVERRYRRTIMSSFHAGFSVGAMLGAISGGLIASQGIGVREHLLVVAALCFAAATLSLRGLLPASADIVERRAGPRRLPRIPRPLLALGIVGFCGLLAEGAMSDWSAVYLRNEVGTGPGTAAAGFAVFSAWMTIGRLTGDRLTDRLGALAVLRCGSGVAAAGLGLIIVSTAPWLALVGFGAVGAGLSVIVPIVFSTAARTPGVPSGPAIAAVTTTGYCGFMTGPPVIGFLADLITLRGAFAFVAVLVLVMALLSGTVRRAEALGDTG